MADSRLPSTDRIKGETTDAFYAYAKYRDLGSARSLGEVTRQLLAEREASGLRIISQDRATKQPSKQKHNGQVSAWSRKFRWVERAAAWDALLDQRLRQKQLDAIEKMAARHASQAEILLHGLMAPAQAFARALQDPNRAVALDAASLPELFKMMLLASVPATHVQKAEQRARGVKIIDSEPISNPASVQGGGAVWNVTIHQPERKEPPPEIESAANPEADEWEEAT